MKVELKRNFSTPLGRFRKGTVVMPDSLRKSLPSDAKVLEEPKARVGRPPSGGGSAEE